MQPSEEHKNKMGWKSQHKCYHKIHTGYRKLICVANNDLDIVFAKIPQIEKRSSNNYGQTFADKPNIGLAQWKYIFKQKKLRNWKGLRKIYINIQNKLNLDSTIREIEKVGTNITKHFPELNQIQISARLCVEITDNHLKAFMSIFGRNSINIQRMVLNLGICPKLTNKGFQMLGIQIRKHFTILREFSIDFTFDKITTKGLKDFAQQIMICKLSHLQLNFSQCDNIAYKDLVMMKSKMKQRFINLKHLEMIDRWGKKIGF